MKARFVVTVLPWPAMIPERIGTIGSTQGVKASSRPRPKNVASTSGSRPSRISAASRSCSETKPPVAPAAVAPGGGPAVAVPLAAGSTTFNRRFSGG